MKLKVLHLILLFALPLISHGQTFTITSSDCNHISLHFELGNFSIDTVRHEGEVMHTIATKGIVIPNDYGLPDLPTFNRFIAIPQDAKATFEVRTIQDEFLTGIDIAPSMGSQAENDAEQPFFKDPKVYAKNSFYPTEAYCIAAPQQLRGVDVIHLGISPFQFNPVTKELAFHREMDIDIRFEGGNGHFGNDRLRSPYWDPILRNNILNYACLKPIDYDARQQQWSQTRATGCEYLIITPDDDAFYEAAQELANFRIKQGILTNVMRITETGATDHLSLKQWFRSIYSTWDIPPAAICLIGENGTDLHQFVPGYRTLHPKDNFITSDNPYADINDDYLPDICFCRILAQNTSELSTLLSKHYEYEYTAPVTDPYYYDHPITAAAWQSAVWFQLTIATISGYLTQHGKTPIRLNEIYSGELGETWSTAAGTSSVVNYFGPDGVGYIPATPGELGGWTGGDADQVISAINSGAYLIQHRDHGWNNKWYQPEIYTTDFGAINNMNLLTYLISVNCRTGMYDSPTISFVESLLRMTRNEENAGIVGAIAPTGQTYSFANDIFLWGVWDHFDPSFMPDFGPYAAHYNTWTPAFACVAGKYFLESQVFPNTDQNKRITTYNTYHTFNDAFLRVFTDIPQPIATTHDESIQCFTPFHITAPEGSNIALTAYYGRKWNILATAIGTGEEQEITILENVPVSSVHLTITGENLIRKEEDITLVPFDRPFVVVESIDMNGGGLTLHYNQEVMADIKVTNVGLQSSNGGTVTLTSSSDQLTVTQGETSFEALASNASQFIGEAFHLKLSDDIHDRTNIPFTLTTQFDGETYSQEYNIAVVAPNTRAELIAIEDEQGNQDGRLDPGEYARLYFRVTNDGHFIAENPRISLTHNEGYIRVITPQTSLSDLEVGDLTIVTFDVYVEFLAGEVPYVHFTLETVINNIHIEEEISTSIGYVLENFETGAFESGYWTNDPLHPWSIVTTSMSFEGSQCAKSFDIDHSETSQLTLVFTSSEPGDISFYRRVSSEFNYDFLSFYIDGEEQNKWSGDLWWAEQTFPVTPGYHSYKWVYSKDHSVDSGSDCAWIDYITLPPHLDETSERTEMPLTVHPNPTTDQIYVELEKEGNFCINVFDSKGNLILTERNESHVSFRDCQAGMYLIVVEQNGQHWSRKILKM